MFELKKKLFVIRLIIYW